LKTNNVYVLVFEYLDTENEKYTQILGSVVCESMHIVMKCVLQFCKDEKQIDKYLSGIDKSSLEKQEVYDVLKDVEGHITLRAYAEAAKTVETLQSGQSKRLFAIPCKSGMLQVICNNTIQFSTVPAPKDLILRHKQRLTQVTSESEDAPVPSEPVADSE
jgi:hypothetical protein